MSAEKTEAVVIRLADFSESSRVVTLFTRDFGKISCLAKGAKRLRSAFDSALDLLSRCGVVFLPRSSGALHLLTEAQLLSRFHPPPRSLSHLYGGYYIAELLEGLNESDDPHPELYDAAVEALAQLSQTDTTAPLPDSRFPILQFELAILRETGHLPDFSSCCLCDAPVTASTVGRFWVSQGGVICSACGRPEFEHTEVSRGTLAIVNRLCGDQQNALLNHLVLTKVQWQEIRRLVTAAICHALGKRPKMLSYLNFKS
ncbi:MAG: DNA repair protein RecO [Planctomycetaceae bacterium]|nr:DNA repair protein RecO [Planctomycetaceae bacterium]